MNGDAVTTAAVLPGAGARQGLSAFHPRALRLSETYAAVGMCGTLLLCDTAALTAAVGLGVTARSALIGGLDRQLYSSLWPLLAVFIVAFRLFHIFPAIGMSPAEELRRSTLAITMVYLIAATFSFLVKEAELYSRLAFLFSWAFAVVLAPACRAAAYGLCARAKWWGYPTAVIAGDQLGEAAVGLLCKRPRLGLRPVALVLDDGQAKRELDMPGVAVVEGLELAARLAREDHLHRALVVMPSCGRRDFARKVREIESLFREVTVLPNLLGLASIPQRIKDVGGMMGIEIRNRLLLTAPRVIKRGLDLALALPLGLAALPVLGLAAVWIKLSDGGPVFYVQRRRGLHGRPIGVIKFRTMYVDAEERLARHLRANLRAREEWERWCKLRDDPRVLPGIGRLLRKFSLDELPQVWNVLRGEMSMVGPRPFPDYHLERFSESFRRLRHSVKPGLTGLWQVEERSAGDLRVQQRYDTYYIENWSVWLDLHIAAKTATVVLSARGAC